VTKDLASHELELAVRKVADGGTYVSPSLAERMVLQLNGALEPPRHAQLSDRELDVMRRLVAGQRPTDIANDLHLSIKTVSTHKGRILERLQLPNLAALIRYGLEQGLGTESAGCAVRRLSSAVAALAARPALPVPVPVVPTSRSPGAA
jgi:DNA-binding NarL/FixJ family response regulator